MGAWEHPARSSSRAGSPGARGCLCGPSNIPASRTGPGTEGGTDGAGEQLGQREPNGQGSAPLPALTTMGSSDALMGKRPQGKVQKRTQFPLCLADAVSTVRRGDEDTVLPEVTVLSDGPREGHGQCPWRSEHSGVSLVPEDRIQKLSYDLL